MNCDPLVTVIMLAYNQEEYIAEAIEGVLSQRCNFTVELIVAEDCSSDGTLDIARHYQRTRPDVVRILTGGGNIGVMPNFYRALSQSRGKYIAMCEGDDWWCNPQKLEMQISLLDEDEGVGLVHGDYVNVEKVGDEWVMGRSTYHGVPLEKLEGYLFQEYLRGGIPRTCTVVMRKEILCELKKTILGKQEYRIGDLQWFVYCAASWRIGYVREVVAAYRHAPGSLTRSGLLATVQRLGSVAEIYANLGHLFGGREDFDPYAELPFHIKRAKAAFRISDRVSFRESISRICAIDSTLLTIGLQIRSAVLFSVTAAKVANRLIDWTYIVKKKLKSVSVRRRPLS